MQHSYSDSAILPLPSIIYHWSMAATTGTPRQTLHRAHEEPNGRQDFSEPIIGIPFHGSCSRCHHFHVNHQFTFSLDSTVHTRLFCERCSHPMFGLGRVSTQNTLASVESGSTFPPQACVDRLGQQQPPSALQVETVPGTSGTGLLTTIAERRSPAASRSTSNIRTPTRTLSHTSLAGEVAGGSIRRDEPVEGRASPTRTAHDSLENQALRPHATTLRRLQTVARRFKKHFSAKSKDWGLRRIRLPSNDTPRVDMTWHSSASASPSEVSSDHEQPENAEPLVSATPGDTEDRHATLRARRRELTLAKEREFASSRKCECGPNCPCNSGSQVPQVDRPDTPDIPVPHYVFPPNHSSTGSSNSQPSQNSVHGLDPLAHIGVIFDSSRRSSSADESSSAADSGSRRIRFSQGSTLWSNGSSISLRARRPLVGRASSMPVGTRAHYLTSARNSSQTTSFNPGSNWPDTARAPTPLNNGSMPERTSHTEPSRSHEGSSQESATSLANLADSQEEELLVNGVSPRSHTPIRDVDEVTPTPRSGIRVDGNSDGVLPVGSDGLSSALQHLANGDATDHEVQSPESQANHASR